MSEQHDEQMATILRAAGNLLLSDALVRVRDAKTHDERVCVNEALTASLAIERYLAALDDVRRPF